MAKLLGPLPNYTFLSHLSSSWFTPGRKWWKHNFTRGEVELGQPIFVRAIYFVTDNAGM
ncbi:hypothetical protein J1N35_029952 [Gossypium stocksii]|uniref:Uncharacterized protein n=1 Tax=Gossypium stocksii TaxID=47602 RepID=A0A9D3UYL0_9ROSI|nr:hypothetical protein J1N35_029952 [Gossypium stocksii]